MASSACISSAVAFSSPSSHKNGSSVGTTKASFFGTRKLRVTKFAARSNVRSVAVCVAADPERPIWFPGRTPPSWLDGLCNVVCSVDEKQ